MNTFATAAAALFIGLGLTTVLPAAAQAADAAKVAEGLAPEVSEVVSGGSWSDGDKGGTYRAMVVMGQEGKAFAAHVYLQWIAFDKNTGAPTIVSNTPIKEVRAQELQNAFIFLEVEKDNEAKLSITSYDPVADKDISLTATATTPGKYSIAK